MASEYVCAKCGAEYTPTIRYQLRLMRCLPCARNAFRAENVRNRALGYLPSRTYNTWNDMKKRCYNPKRRDYKYYGERGITICDRWRESYANFLADMGEKPPGLTIERINNDGNYEPGNCKWATYAEQNRNKRRCATSPESSESNPVTK